MLTAFALFINVYAHKLAQVLPFDLLHGTKPPILAEGVALPRSIAVLQVLQSRLLGLTGVWLERALYDVLCHFFHFCLFERDFRFFLPALGYLV